MSTDKTPSSKTEQRAPRAKVMAAEIDGEDAVATDPAEVVEELKRRDLIDMIVAETGVKKKFAKPVIDAMLAQMGATLAEGRPMNLPPMGKLRVNRSTETEGATTYFCRVRMPKLKTEDDAVESGETDVS
ncbi:HU family DNA-binding protein [Chachezhania sediminis]|uniref:HU family DNA-binding protein n=1 Tax=Chachezhania sediminis TaxID=2599291 RepID=UPI00131EB02C|nr:HU family DNA-binding protein [Chachezhania sediminis]